MTAQPTNTDKLLGASQRLHVGVAAHPPLS